ncbi:hypothetical protein [Photobacterium kishitanii]|uniref:Uncharacterized protein n=1 Tax=Photobacterium kishitanii TaxID=318456 RepID=A0A2T3KMP0_9GAMM|nr:hypothetical protein [Photobacterium kishitanii]PSV01059.1 hypothetical protein C9J27_03310 [Photobacterium kishitanii]
MPNTTNQEVSNVAESNGDKPSSVHYFSYRYNDNGESKTTKASLDKDIYLHFLDVFNGSRTATHAELIRMAKLIRETQDGKYAGFLREAILRKIIKPELIEGYDFNPNYVKVMCAKDSKSNTAVNIPSALYYALSKLLCCDKPDMFINNKYIEIRNNKTGITNFSLELRKNLLNSVLNK